MKGLSLEQVDKMLEEVNPRHSSKWKPSTTFAMDMGVVGKGHSVGGGDIRDEGEGKWIDVGKGDGGWKKGAHVESVQLSPKARG